MHSDKQISAGNASALIIIYRKQNTIYNYQSTTTRIPKHYDTIQTKYVIKQLYF